MVQPRLSKLHNFCDVGKKIFKTFRTFSLIGNIVLLYCKCLFKFDLVMLSFDCNASKYSLTDFKQTSINVIFMIPSSNDLLNTKICLYALCFPITMPLVY